MNLKKQLPNFLTLLNLLAGTIATYLAANGKLVDAALFVFLGIIFDYFDGFLARILNVQGELGKQLDSLADVVTSGVVPGIVMFQLLNESLYQNMDFKSITWGGEINYLPYLGFLITLAAAYRLAKFNIDERQSNSFIGLPTPAASLFIVSLPLILMYNQTPFIINLIHTNWILLLIIIGLSYLMNAEIPLFALKFKDFSFKKNSVKYLFILISILAVVVLQFVAIPLIISVYVLLSVSMNYLKSNVI